MGFTVYEGVSYSIVWRYSGYREARLQTHSSDQNIGWHWRGICGVTGRLEYTYAKIDAEDKAGLHGICR
jgi:hypothetical protein